MAANLLDMTRNFSMYTIPAGWVLAIAPHFYAIALGKFDNRSPRGYVAAMKEDQSIDKATKATISRAEGAQQNGFENLGFFAAAVVAGNIAKLDNSTLNLYSMGYLASRVLYNFIYINNESATTANARTVTYLSGVGMLFTLFIKSGNVLRGQL